MVSDNIIVYEYDFFEKISQSFSAVLEDDILEKLLEIKKNNKFIRRRSPLRLKYKISVADTWRKKREDIENVSLEERIINSLNSNLNKLSNANYPPVSTLIIDDYKLLIDNDIDPHTFIVTISNKAMTDNVYSCLYSRLLHEISVLNPDIQEIIIGECNTFFGQTNQLQITDSYDLDNYDELCELIKKKSKLTGGFVFISNLYKYKLVSYQMMLDYYNSLVSYTKISPPDLIGKYIDAIVNIISNCGDDLEKENPEKFKETFLKICYDLTKDKNTLIAKYRFKILDICDKYDNK